MQEDKKYISDKNITNEKYGQSTFDKKGY